MTDPVSIARVQATFPGDGGFNAPHQWHLTGAEVVDATSELCDGQPSHLDADLDGWLTNVKTDCPWSAVVVAVEPFAGGNPTPAWRSLQGAPP